MVINCNFLKIKVNCWQLPKWCRFVEEETHNHRLQHHAVCPNSTQCCFKAIQLHFTTLNYTSYYISHPKLFECMFCTLNYDFCYILHHAIKFVVNLDENSKFIVNLNENSKFRMQRVIRSIIYGGKV